MKKCFNLLGFANSKILPPSGRWTTAHFVMNNAYNCNLLHWLVIKYGLIKINKIIPAQRIVYLNSLLIFQQARDFIQFCF